MWFSIARAGVRMGMKAEGSVEFEGKGRAGRLTRVETGGEVVMSLEKSNWRAA